MALPSSNFRGDLETVYAAAIACADPARAVREVLQNRNGTLQIADFVLPAQARLFVLAAGKAAAVMARTVEEIAGERISAGIAVTPSGFERDLARIALRCAGHPAPDSRSESVGREVLEFLQGLRPGDVLLVLLSGGASSLLACPVPEISLEALQATNTALLRGGANIAEINAVRKHLTLLSGGRLAAQAEGIRKEVLVISDVSGDDLSVIGSGPFAPDSSSFASALAVLERLRLLDRIPSEVVRYLRDHAGTGENETVRADAECLRFVRHHLLVTNRDACEAAAKRARELGFRVFLAPTPLCGDAQSAGRALATLIKSALCKERALWILGGETTVTLSGVDELGRGGRCQELALAAALAFQGVDGVALLAAGSDGIDGTTQAAGAFVDGETLRRGAQAGLDAREHLARHDSGSFFEREGGRFAPGATGTNVMDIVLIARER